MSRKLRGHGIGGGRGTRPRPDCRILVLCLACLCSTRFRTLGDGGKIGTESVFYCLAFTATALPPRVLALVSWSVTSFLISCTQTRTHPRTHTSSPPLPSLLLISYIQVRSILESNTTHFRLQPFPNHLAGCMYEAYLVYIYRTYALDMARCGSTVSCQDIIALIRVPSLPSVTLSAPLPPSPGPLFSKHGVAIHVVWQSRSTYLVQVPRMLAILVPLRPVIDTRGSRFPADTTSQSSFSPSSMQTSDTSATCKQGRPWSHAHAPPPKPTHPLHDLSNNGWWWPCSLYDWL
ncbi:hypothetical protein J3F83DRAFT_753457 [Trichoderma novae-zelandiae]